MDPLVSVIIPAYNAGAYLKAALYSVLCQSYTNLEILVVDDGSTDGSIGVVTENKDTRVRLIRQQNCGKPVAMNRALDEMRGEYYVIQDADDLSHPRRIERQIGAMRSNDEVAAVYCGHELLIGKRRVAPRFRSKNSECCRNDIINFRMPAHDPTGMYRVAKVAEYRYDPALPVVEGLDYILRIGETYPVFVLGECLYQYRIHPDSVTKADPLRREMLVREVLRLACERRGLNFEELFPSSDCDRVSNRIRDNGIATHFMESVVDLRSVGRWLDAIWTGVYCAKMCPTDAHYYKALVYAILSRKMRRRLRPSEQTDRK